MIVWTRLSQAKQFVADTFWYLGTHTVLCTIAGFLSVFVLILSCVNHVEAYESGLALDLSTQTVFVQSSGVHFTAPWILVSVLDNRPQRVCVTSGTHSVNCRLVQFDPTHYREFVDTEGWRYYWLSNRISFNLGYGEEYRGFRDVLRGYGFGAKTYPFVKLLGGY